MLPQSAQPVWLYISKVAIKYVIQKWPLFGLKSSTSKRRLLIERNEPIMTTDVTQGQHLGGLGGGFWGRILYKYKYHHAHSKTLSMWLLTISQNPNLQNCYTPQITAVADYQCV